MSGYAARGYWAQGYAPSSDTETPGTAPGALLEVTASFLAGAATGVRNPTAPGVLDEVTASFIAGSASGNVSQDGTAPGADFEVLASFLAGAASAVRNGTAEGREFVVQASFIAGRARAFTTPKTIPRISVPDMTVRISVARP